MELNRLSDGRAELLVIDSGVGIEDHARERLFEPYFSTRAPGGGTGLGWFSVVAIVESLGGDISVDSEPGNGTAVSVTIPTAREASAPAAASRDVPVSTPDPGDSRAEPAASGQVLVVDDDVAVLDVMVSALQALGYEVTGCSSGAEALDLIDSGVPSACC